MNSLRAIVANWRQDNLLRRVLRNTGYLFLGNTLSTVVQSVFAARLLGVLGFGVLGTVISFASNINRLLSFRMGELVVRYMGGYLGEGRKQSAAAVLKASLLLESGASLLAYLLLLGVAPWAARVILKDASLAPLFSFYALALLANFITESSTGVLQVGNSYRSQAVINLVQSLVTAGLVVYAFIVQGDIWLVMSAYLAGKSLNGLALAAAGWRRARQLLGAGWWRVSFRHLPPKREFWNFALSTNLSGTITLVTRDSEVIFVSYFLSALDAGYYKLAMAVINLVVTPITPFINTSFPEIARSVAQKAWKRLRQLLARLTVISGAWTLAVSLGLLLAGNWLVSTFYGEQFTPAMPIVLILLVGYGTANILYWNRTLLLSLDRPGFALGVMGLCGLTKVALSFLLVPRYGVLAEAVLLSAYFFLSVGIQAGRGLYDLRRQEQEAPE